MEPTTSPAYHGGVISTHFNTSLTFLGTAGFSNNSANDDGGAIYAEAETLLKFNVLHWNHYFRQQLCNARWSNLSKS